MRFNVRGWIDNSMAVYCLSAGALFGLSSQFRKAFDVMRWIPTWVLTLALVFVIPYAITRSHDELRSICLLILPPLIVTTVLARDGNAAPWRLAEGLRQLGLVSYSLYLWHNFPMVSHARIERLAIPAAWISYHYIEKPIIAFGHRWSKVIKGQPRETTSCARVPINRSSTASEV